MGGDMNVKCKILNVKCKSGIREIKSSFSHEKPQPNPKPPKSPKGGNQ